MRRNIAVALIIATLATLGAAIGSALSPPVDKIEAVPPSPSPVVTAAKVAEIITKTYIVRSFNGYLAVFDELSGELILETDISTDNLRKTDTELLKIGIRAQSYSEVVSIMEDYSN